MDTMHDIIARIEAAVDTDHFDFVQAECVDALKAAGVGSEAIAPLLGIYERHPVSDFGMPGSMLHFVEAFDRQTYVPLLLASFARRPAAHTAWALNRVLNAEKDEASRQAMLDLMKAALDREDVEPEVKAEIQNFLRYQSENE